MRWIERGRESEIERERKIERGKKERGREMDSEIEGVREKKRGSAIKIES